MFAVDLCAVHASHSLATRVQPALLASRPSVLPVAQRPNASLCHKRDRRFAPEKPSVPPAHTVVRTSRFPSAPCALLLRSFSQERKSTPSFSMACARFCRNGGSAHRRKINRSYSMICGFDKTPITKKSAQNDSTNRSAGPQPAAQPRMREPRVYVIVSGRAHVLARPVAPHHKLLIRGGHQL
jgi:hypothetical protein